MKRIVRSAVSSALSVLALMLVTVPAKAEVIHNYNDDPHWVRIVQPVVSYPVTSYPDVQIMPGDQVSVRAGGCVQTGGKGKTWKHYVYPQGPNSAYFYHGQIKISGLFNAPTDFSDLNITIDEHGFTNNWSTPFIVTEDGFPDYALSLGYTDDVYEDNGYYSHDNGTADQCKYLGPAYVDIYIRHPGEY